MQKWSNNAKHADCVLLPFVMTPSVLQQKEKKMNRLDVAPDMKSDSASLFQMLAPDKGRDIEIIKNLLNMLYLILFYFLF